MNYRRMMISTIKGESVSALPFVPRMDLWYKANKKNGTLPYRYRNATLAEITDDLEIGYHAAVPDFRDYSDETGDSDLGLGIYRFKTIPYKVILHNVKQKTVRENGLTTVEYDTPYGLIRTKILYSEEMRKSGATISHVVEHAIKSVKDFDAAAYIFENAEVCPAYGHYLEYQASIGDRGLLVAFNSLSASPYHFIMKELMNTERFFYESFDYPDELQQLAQRLSPYYEKVFDAVLKSPAEVILSGANYDSSITTPPLFKEFFAPSLKKQAEACHQNGKFLLTHTDGENRGLLEQYPGCGFDIADSICPAPMTSHTLKEVRQVFDGKITIWGGIPSVSVLENTMSDFEFEEYLDMTLENIGKGDHLILSIADTTPAGAKFERIQRIAKKAKEFGPVIVGQDNPRNGEK